MATEFNPGGSVKKDNAARGSMNPPTTPAPKRKSWGMIGALAAIAVLVVLGMLFSLKETGTSVSDNTPGATTGSSTTPSPSNPPPASGAQGQGESNSTR
jgi:hypothetical protein